MLGEGVALQHVNDAVGRGIVAQKALQGGSTVIKPCEPWLKYPILDNSCSNCGCPLPDRSFPCNNENCHEEYCSRDCRTMALGLYHRHVCYNEAFQNIELDVYAQLHAAQKDGDVSVRNATAAQLLALRVISAALIVQTVPSVLPQMRILSGKLSFNPKTLGGSMLHLYERLSRALQIQTIISYEEFLGVLARITANCFQREDSIELHHARSMMNHSCRANAAEDGMTGAIVTKQPVEEGGEVCINYYPQLKDLPYAERTVELRRRGFVCQCTQCQKKI
ncbi:SET and MYND domain-containing protein [Angomonas deanei]|nr:SET and MYND domain-containing protein [Angomonas deanei]|eukprot:EPY38549.1 SET and MYND domain-containing protein [Angomonas deanei]